MAQNSPVLRHRDWRFLLRDFTGAHPAFLAASSKNLQLGLGPAASVARWILLEQPSLLERETLTVLIPGAAEIECADEGRWFSFLPWLLGRPELIARVHLVGVELDRSVALAKTLSASQSHATPAAPLVQHYPAAQLFKGRLSEWRASTAAEPVDACVLFSPGFSTYYENWFAPGELGDYLTTVPTALFSYSDLDAQEDQAVLAWLGVKYKAQALAANPWALEHSQQEAIGGFGGYPWSLTNVEIPAKLDYQNAEIAEFMELQQLLPEEAEQWGPDGALRRLSTSEEFSNGPLKDTLYYLPRDLGVLRSSGLVGYTDEEGFTALLPKEKRIPEEVLAARPAGNELACALWALRTYRDHVEPLLQDLEADGEEDIDLEDMFAAFAKQATCQNADDWDFMDQIRLSGGVHGPTHPCWFDMLETLGWNPDEYDDEPERFDPAFWVTGPRFAPKGLPVVCEAYAYIPGDADDKLANEAMRELGARYPDGVMLGFKSMPFIEVGGNKYSFGGLLWWKGAWHPFAMTPGMTSIDAVIEQVQSGFTFEKGDPKYADNNTMLAVPFNRMCYGLDPNAPGRMMGLGTPSGWVTLMPAE